MTDTITLSREDFEKVKDALDFYANDENWSKDDTQGFQFFVEREAGAIAKSALAILSKLEQKE